MSTCHVSEETSKILSDVDSYLPINVYNKTNYGWFIYLPTNKNKKEDAEILKELPKDLALLYVFARANECDVICLDCDGEELDELPIYEW